jgi:hypothetical protein
MKFSVALSTLVLLLPVLSRAAAVPRDAGELVPRFGQGRGRRQGGFRGGRGGGRGGNQNNGGATSSTVASAAAEPTQGAGGDTDGDDDGGDNGGDNGGDDGGDNGGDDGDNDGGGNTDGNNGGGNPQTSLTLDPAVIQQGLAQDGQAVAEAGQVASLTSTNNFINFCLTTNLPLTDGQQKKDGSCNPTPMGVIVAQNRMPSAKFTNPKNGDTIPANEAFDIDLAVTNMETGNFVNPQTNYFGAPAQVNGGGVIIAHSHVVIQKLPSLDTTEVPDPTVFAFFKGLNGKDQGGVLTTTVSSATTAGVPAGAYRLCSINTAANHQPILVAVAQHGSLDDCVYFTAE